MDFKRLENKIKAILQDGVVSRNESYVLRELAADLSIDELHFIRNRAFDLTRERLSHRQCRTAKSSRLAIDALEKIVKAIESHSTDARINNAYFSPGEDCQKRLIQLCSKAQRSLDVCVFTISDDRLSQAILNAHQRGVNVRVITDDDKSEDRGSDIKRLISSGIAVRMDNASSHMHHKFVIRDKQLLANGSFNWTRSATIKNQENVLVTDQPKLVQDFLRQFEALWKQFH